MHVQHLLYIFDIVPFRDFVDLIACVRKDTLDFLKKNVIQFRTNTLSVVQDCADAGWWMGEIGGRKGVFPDNFVKILEVEKEVTLSCLLTFLKSFTRS